MRILMGKILVNIAIVGFIFPSVSGILLYVYYRNLGRINDLRSPTDSSRYYYTSSRLIITERDLKSSSENRAFLTGPVRECPNGMIRDKNGVCRAILVAPTTTLRPVLSTHRPGTNNGLGSGNTNNHYYETSVPATTRPQSSLTTELYSYLERPLQKPNSDNEFQSADFYSFNDSEAIIQENLEDE